VDALAQTEGEGEEKGEGKEKDEGEWSVPKDPTWAAWKKTIGKQFEKPHRPCNWLGGKVVSLFPFGTEVESVPCTFLSDIQPFPLNPSFKPPTPVSDALRSTLYKSFMADPEAHSVRSLASRYHLSIKRVDAILRLKGLEESWIKVCPALPSFSSQILAG
jgi:hypothetical protein